jgi:hypothetical protein
VAGFNSGALATVVGALIEVPVMLWLVRINNSRLVRTHLTERPGTQQQMEVFKWLNDQPHGRLVWLVRVLVEDGLHGHHQPQRCQPAFLYLRRDQDFHPAHGANFHLLQPFFRQNGRGALGKRAASRPLLTGAAARHHLLFVPAHQSRYIGFTSLRPAAGVTFAFLISSPLVDLASVILLASIFNWSIATPTLIGWCWWCRHAARSAGQRWTPCRRLYAANPCLTSRKSSDAPRSRATFGRRSAIFYACGSYVLIGVGIRRGHP